MNLKIFLALLVFILFVNIANSFPFGAPLSTCQTLFPGHQVQNQKTDAPFRIFVETNHENTEFNVSIVASEKEDFKGFILQARSSSNPNLLINGEFSENNLTKAINCQSEKDTLTHKTAEPKNLISALWKPLSSVENIHFNATVVKSKQVFWTNLTSANIILKQSSESKNYLQDPLEAEYNGCGSSKNCFGLDDNCVLSKSCNLLLAATFDGNDSVTFELFAKSSVAQWFAMGLSLNGRMGFASVTECDRNTENQVVVKESWNTDEYSNTYVNEEERVVHIVKTQFAEGVLKCIWRRNLSTTVRGFHFNLFNSYVLLSYGQLENGIKHIHTKKIASSKPINFTQVSQINGDKSIPVLIKIHGCLMIMVWLVLVSNAIVLARYSRDLWEEKAIFGKPIWFSFHRALMLTSITIAIISMVLIVTHVGGLRMDSIHAYLVFTDVSLLEESNNARKKLRNGKNFKLLLIGFYIIVASLLSISMVFVIALSHRTW
ncbi:putative ferric-chelate reductase 1-like protein [Dinothrombium tinctorium]|uniref:Putative ferric-chelate reductase 1-like protein n=1 Tax=Dinothrombium tinctorium TaxID=1965070 RepID=A0A3S3SP25_9ACAR|nr:putative ferric-chelate reductase 1-like protein [Dinothrombium tinctorium]